MVKRKGHPKVQVPYYGAKNRKRVPLRWRKQRGIDNKQRVYVRCHGASPKVGYKNAAGVRFAGRDGAFRLLVYNERDLETFPKGNYVAVLAHGLSKRKRAALEKAADSKGIGVANKTKVKEVKVGAKPEKQSKADVAAHEAKGARQ